MKRLPKKGRDTRFKKGGPGGPGRPKLPTRDPVTRLSLDEIDAIVAEWEESPRKMLNEGVRIIGRTMVIMNDLLVNPGEGRNSDVVQVRAAGILLTLTADLKDLRRSLPVVCPSCDHKFQP